MRIRYLGPFDALEVPDEYTFYEFGYDEPVDVPDELGARLLEQAQFQPEAFDLAALDDEALLEWVGPVVTNAAGAVVTAPRDRAEVALISHRRRPNPDSKMVALLEAVLGHIARGDVAPLDADHGAPPVEQHEISLSQLLAAAVIPPESPDAAGANETTPAAVTVSGDGTAIPDDTTTSPDPDSQED